MLERRVEELRESGADVEITGGLSYDPFSRTYRPTDFPGESEEETYEVISFPPPFHEDDVIWVSGKRDENSQDNQQSENNQDDQQNEGGPSDQPCENEPDDQPSEGEH